MGLQGLPPMCLLLVRWEGLVCCFVLLWAEVGGSISFIATKYSMQSQGIGSCEKVALMEVFANIQ